MRRASKARRSTSCRFMRKEHRKQLTATCAWESPRTCESLTTAFASCIRSPSCAKRQSSLVNPTPKVAPPAKGPQLAYRNGTMYSSYTAASFARKLDLAERHGVNLDGALTWAFEFENQPLFAGFRSLATGGIDKPVLNVFRMFSKMGCERLAAESDGARSLDDILKSGVRGEPDIAALASRAGQRVCVLVWHYHDDDVPGPAAQVTLEIAGLAKPTFKLSHYRIDHDHSNAYSAWQAMGSPQSPTKEQYAELCMAGELALLEKEKPGELAAKEGAASIEFALPRQGVSLLVLE